MPALKHKSACEPPDIFIVPLLLWPSTGIGGMYLPVAFY